MLKLVRIGCVWRVFVSCLFQNRPKGYQRSSSAQTDETDIWNFILLKHRYLNKANRWSDNGKKRIRSLILTFASRPERPPGKTLSKCLWFLTMPNGSVILMWWQMTEVSRENSKKIGNLWKEIDITTFRGALHHPCPRVFCTLPSITRTQETKMAARRTCDLTKQ